MAIAFAHVSIHSRAKGHSSVAGAAYRAGVKLYDEKTGETHDFRKRQDVAYASLVLPDGANPTFADREMFWNTVEFFEKRGDAQVAKDYVLALPKELSLEDNIALARNFAFTHFVSEGLVVDISIHDHGDGNPHAHIYVPTRRVLENSLSPTKARDLNPRFAAGKGGKGFVSESDAWGEKWRDYQNQYFKSNGIDLEVDENYLFSQRHEGNIRSEAHYLKEENTLRRQASIEVALTSPEAVINALATKYPTFNEKKIESFITKNTNTAEQKEAALVAVMSHSELVYLGIGEDGRRTYTSQGNFLKEAEVAHSCEVLSAQQENAIPPESLNATIAAFSLNSEQADALQVICSGTQLVSVVGRAGTGKSYMLRAANQVFENAGQRVYGMAISGIAAQGLSEAGIASNTIAHYRKRIEHDNWKLKQGDVVIMDEAGMTGLHDMHEIVRHVKASGAKLILVGDYDQLQPINSAPTFKAIVERTGFCELSQIMRQEKAGDRQASTWLSQQKVDCALAHYYEQGDIHFSRTQIDADNQLVRDWFAALDNRPTSQIILAHTNAHVETLNHLVRTRLMTAGLLAEDLQTRYQTSQGEISLSVGDRVLLKRNDSSLGVKNGQLATVKACEDGKLTLILDAEQRIVQINTAEYQDFYYGYATTIHKSQGATFDKVFVAAQGAGWDRYLSYVALSRHKKQVKLYASHESYQSIAEMTKAFSKRTLLDSALNYPLMYGIRRGFEADGLIARFLAKIGLAKQKMVDVWQQVRGFEKIHTEVDGKKPVYAYQVAAQQAKNIRAIKVASFADLHREVGKGWADLRNGTKNEKTSATAQNTPLNPPFEWLEKMVAKNQLGAEIYAQYQEFETACTLNFVKIETLAQCHQKAQAINLLTQYIDAYQQGKTSHQLQIARKLEKLNTGYYSELSYLALKKQLDVKTLYSHIKQSQQKAQDYAVISASDMCDKPVLRAALAYIQAEERRKAQWRGVFALNCAWQLSDAQKAYYASLAHIRDKHAATLLHHLNHDKAISCFNLDKATLAAQAKQHHYRTDVALYQNESNATIKAAFAEMLLSDKAYSRYIFEANIDWKTLYKDKKQFEHQKHLQACTKADRKNYQLIAKYQQARIDTAVAFGQVNRIQPYEKSLEKFARINALALLNTRDKLAYQMLSNIDAYLPLFDKTKVKLADLEKHALAYHKKLSAQTSDPATRHLRKFTHKRLQKSAQTYQPKNAKAHHLDYEAITNALNSMGEQFYAQVLGFKGTREGVNNIRYGQGHALVYAHSGAKAGSWHSFASGEGGGILQLLMSPTHGLGLSFKEALIEGAKIAGIAHPEQQSGQAIKKEPQTQTQVQNTHTQIKARTQEITDKDKIAFVQNRFNQAQPINGTLGETYLRTHRKIMGNIDAVRFQSNMKYTITAQNGQKITREAPAIIVAARNEKDEVTATQTIFLDKTTGNKAKKEIVGIVKRSHGVVKGSAVQLQAGHSKMVLFAEGIETALSLTQVYPKANIYVTLGNIANLSSLAWVVKKHHAKDVFVAADNDGDNKATKSALYKVAQSLKDAHNLSLYFTQPELEGEEKRDFNDVLQAGDLDKLKKQAKAWRAFKISEKEIPMPSQMLKTNLEKIQLPKETQKDSKITLESAKDKNDRTSALSITEPDFMEKMKAEIIANNPDIANKPFPRISISPEEKADKAINNFTELAQNLEAATSSTMKKFHNDNLISLANNIHKDKTLMMFVRDRNKAVASKIETIINKQNKTEKKQERGRDRGDLGIEIE